MPRGDTWQTLLFAIAKEVQYASATCYENRPHVRQSYGREERARDNVALLRPSTL